VRRAARRDDNHKDIVRGLRQIPGCTVADTGAVGAGFPDIVVGYKGRNYLLEIKDGDKSPSRCKKTDDQETWHRVWGGQVAVVYGLSDAILVIQSNQRGME